MKPTPQVLVLSLALAAACTEAPAVSAPAVEQAASASMGRPQNDERYVAIGTSVSMGWESNGVYDAVQRVSWPALLGFATDRGITLPLIQSPGCTSPLVPPLAAGLRLSGESAAGSTVCAPNDAGVVLPTQNLGLASALAVDALETTPEATSYPWFARVLPPETTALGAALGEHPTLVSVELGANEVLGALSGLAVSGVTMVPLPYFTQPYDALLDAVKTTGARAVLVGLPQEARNMPALRRGDEIWADRAEFAALHVDVSDNCQGSPNYINVSVNSLNLVFTGAFTSAHGLPNPVFSCADVPGTEDLILTPADLTMINGVLAQMSDHIRAQAAARGYAYFSLGALYDMPGLKSAKYSVVTQLTSRNPFGPLMSLDGVHPSPFGHAVLATAAALAIDRTFHNGAHPLAPVASLAEEFDEAPDLASRLEQARRFAAAHQGEHVIPCPITGRCDIARLRRMH